eukprot:scaffold1436_cov250-Pinguiococcus_pyrenoidosus.AAC.4
MKHSAVARGAGKHSRSRGPGHASLSRGRRRRHKAAEHGPRAPRTHGSRERGMLVQRRARNRVFAAHLALHREKFGGASPVS